MPRVTDPAPPAPRLSLDDAAAAIRGGRLVAFGTETVYGLGADATNPAAVAAVFAAKQRPAFDPLIVHVASAAAVPDAVADWSPRQQRLAAAFWPGPLTMLAPRGDRIAELVTSGLPDVAVRVPGTDAARQLIARAGCPVAAPSANLFGRISPTTADHVLDQLAGRIAGVLDTGPCGVGLESTVVRVPADESQPVRVLRLGGLTLEAIAAVAGEAELAADSDRAELTAPQSPGRLPQHYAPRVPLRLVETPQPSPDEGLLAWQNPVAGFGAVEVLTPTGSDAEAAAALFAALRRLDEAGVRAIQAERVPDAGLGAAINDRLRRAAHPG